MSFQPDQPWPAVVCQLCQTLPLDPWPKISRRPLALTATLKPAFICWPDKSPQLLQPPLTTVCHSFQTSPLLPMPKTWTRPSRFVTATRLVTLGPPWLTQPFQPPPDF